MPIKNHPERLDVCCSECGAKVPAGIKKFKTEADGSRVRISPCCGAPTVRDLTSRKFVEFVKENLDSRAAVSDKTLEGMRYLRVPLRLLSKRDLLRLIYWMVERELRPHKDARAILDVLLRVGLVGTEMFTEGEAAEGCRLKSVCPHVLERRE